jgi:CheY-like chemotaxis protein
VYLGNDSTENPGWVLPSNALTRFSRGRGLGMHTNSIIMLVDDSSDDLELMRIAFKRAGIHNAIAEMHSGEQAIAYLSGEGEYADRRHFPLPCIVITDLKMPGVDGFQLLEWLKGQSAFDRVPKIVLTASRHGEMKGGLQNSAALLILLNPSSWMGW